MRLVPVEVIGFAPPSEPVPGVQEAFLALADERGWKVGGGYVLPWEDDEGEHGGFWSVLVYRNEVRSGETLHYRLEISPEALRSRNYTEFWARLLDMADALWEDFCEKQQATSSGASG